MVDKESLDRFKQSLSKLRALFGPSAALLASGGRSSAGSLVGSGPGHRCSDPTREAWTEPPHMNMLRLRCVIMPQPLHALIQAAVDPQVGAGDVRPSLPGEEHDRRRHLLNGAQSSQRDAAELV